MRKLLSVFLIALLPSLAFAFTPAWNLMIAPTIASGVCAASYGSELLTTQNATAPAGITEADATTGWTSGGLLTFASSETAPLLGSSHLDVVADSANDVVSLDMSSLSASTVYKLSFYVRHNGTGGGWECGIGSAATDRSIVWWTVDNTATTYFQKTFNFLKNNNEDTFACIERNATNDGGVYLDNVSIKAATLCYGAELNTNANAATPGAGEANATTGWTNINTLNSFSSVSTGTPNDGTYHILADATTNPVANNGFNVDLSAAPFSMQVGSKYFIRFFVKHIGSGDAWMCGHANGATIATNANPQLTITNTTTTYFEVGYEITYAASLRYFVCTESGSNNNGGIYLDKFSVKAISSE